MVTESLGSSIAPVLISHVVIKQLGIALFSASSSGMNFGLSQMDIHNIPFTIGDYMHMMMRDWKQHSKASQNI